MAKDISKKYGYEELLARARELATPVDVDGLIAAGAIRQSGAWYEVLDITKMSDHARQAFKSLKQSTIKLPNGERKPGPLFVKFRKPSAKLAKYLKTL